MIKTLVNHLVIITPNTFNRIIHSPFYFKLNKYSCANCYNSQADLHGNKRLFYINDAARPAGLESNY